MTSDKAPETPDSASAVAGARRRRKFLAVMLVVAVVGLPVGGYAGYLMATTNFHTVIEGKVYRSAQPSPKDIKEWSARYGIKTVLNLRGDDQPAAVAEAQAAREVGATYINHRTAAEALPSSLWFRDMVATLETAQTPLLLHCKAGSDRSGVASVMAAMAIGNQPYDQARGQLTLWYGHFHFYNEIGRVMDQYEAYRAGLPGKPGNGGWKEFRQWATEVYHPLYYFVRITAPAQIDAKPGQTATVEVEIKNLTDKVLPAGAKQFSLACFIGSSIDQKPDRELGPRVNLPSATIQPDQSIKVSCRVDPQPAGTYEVHFDLIEENQTWFARQGSRVPTMRLVVGP